MSAFVFFKDVNYFKCNVIPSLAVVKIGGGGVETLIKQ